MNEWIDRLQRRFSALRDTRADDSPVYAIEHGLGEEERRLLGLALRDQLIAGPPRLEHLEAWVVHATEIGYGFDGDRYWPIFFERTRGWPDTDHWRDQLRTFFEHFKEKYGGAEPQGTWKDWRGIIVWPITHALVPKDLQAKLLEAFVRFTDQGHSWVSPAEIGRLVEAAAPAGRSDRFQRFLGQHALIGEFLLGLRHLGSDKGTGLDSSTLERICKDIAATPLAKERLARVRFRLAGGKGRRGTHTGRQARPPAVEEDDAGGTKIAPWLMVKPAPGHDRRWDLYLWVPCLAGLAAKSQVLAQALELRDLEVNGAKRGTVVDPGGMLDSEREVPLAEWPLTDVPLLSLRGAHQDLQSEFQSALSTRGAPRLTRALAFSINDGGTGWLQMSPSLRPGRSYLLALPSPIPQVTTPAACRAGNAYWTFVELPSVVGDAQRRMLEGVGLTVARSAVVTAVGLPPVRTDTDGTLAWCEDETPCFEVSADHLMRNLRLTCEGEPEPLLLGDVRGDERRYFALDDAPVGRHTFSLQYDGEGGRRERMRFDLDILSRAELPPNEDTDGVLQVHLAPARASLEQLWTSRAKLSVMAPDGVDLHARVTFLKSDGEIAGRASFSAKAPLLGDKFADAFARGAKRKLDGVFDLTHRATLELEARRGDLLLAMELRSFERREELLRWCPSGLSPQPSAELIDDRPGGEEVRILHAAFDRPWDFSVSAPVRARGVVRGQGGEYGIFGAKGGDQECWVVIEEPGATPPALSVPEEVNWGELLQATLRWGAARVVGDGHERTRVEEVLEVHLWERVGVSNAWLRDLVECLEAHPGQAADVALANVIVRGLPPFYMDRAFAGKVVELYRANRPQDIERAAYKVAVGRLAASPHPLAALLGTARGVPTAPGKGLAQQQVITPQWIADFALTLAKHPPDALKCGKQLTQELGGWLKRFPIIIRGALLLASRDKA